MYIVLLWCICLRHSWGIPSRTVLLYSLSEGPFESLHNFLANQMHLSLNTLGRLAMDVCLGAALHTDVVLLVEP